MVDVYYIMKVMEYLRDAAPMVVNAWKVQLKINMGQWELS